MKDCHKPESSLGHTVIPKLVELQSEKKITPSRSRLAGDHKGQILQGTYPELLSTLNLAL